MREGSEPLDRDSGLRHSGDARGAIGAGAGAQAVAETVRPVRALLGACGRGCAAAGTLLLLLCALLLHAPPAFAHASLLRAEPADGEIVADAPATLRLFFNE